MNVITFGKLRGVSFADAINADPKYIEWLLAIKSPNAGVNACLRELVECPEWKAYKEQEVVAPIGEWVGNDVKELIKFSGTLIEILSTTKQQAYYRHDVTITKHLYLITDGNNYFTYNGQINDGTKIYDTAENQKVVITSARVCEHNIIKYNGKKTRVTKIKNCRILAGPKLKKKLLSDWNKM